jgi:hypothetical protein
MKYNITGLDRELNDLGAFLQKLINAGLTNLKDSPLGQKKI